ncbi:MAG: RidA family protein [Bacteroidia bacterium]|nr:RidA family protein [Bacteroidia bacterium]
MDRKLISSGSRFEEQVSYSRAVVVGQMVFVAGCTGYDYQNHIISDDIVEQAEQCFKNIEVALLQAGSSLADVVRVHYILKDPTAFDKCWPVIKKYFGEVKPAATAFCAQLLNEEMKIEIEVTAVKR